MFNKNDDMEARLGALVTIVEGIPPNPCDYFRGLPDVPLIIPQNILLFSRQEPFDDHGGTEHHRYVFVVALQGEGDVMVDTSVLRLAPGHAIMIMPYQFHHYARFSSTDLSWLFMTFDLAEADALPALRERVFALSPLQCSCLRQVAACYPTAAAAGAADAQLTACATLLLALFPEENGGTDRHRQAGLSLGLPLVQRVARYVHAHVAEPLPLVDLARAVGVSESHLRARFRQLTGVAPGTYIRRYRLHRAQVLLRSTVLPVKTVSARCGFDSIYSFCRAFRHAVGMSPGAYRRHQAQHAL